MRCDHRQDAYQTRFSGAADLPHFAAAPYSTCSWVHLQFNPSTIGRALTVTKRFRDIQSESQGPVLSIAATRFA